jgi:hypothetical protein
MNQAARWIPGQKAGLATLLILLFAVSSALQAQNIYKCGNSYSQTPCPGANTLNLKDAREPAQKLQTDEATRRDEKLAAELEKNRLAQEQAARVHTPAAPAVTAPTSTPSANNVVSKITPKRIKPKHHKPEAFIALVPGSDKQAIKKKSRKKKTPPSE